MCSEWRDALWLCSTGKLCSTRKCKVSFCRYISINPYLRMSVYTCVGASNCDSVPREWRSVLLTTCKFFFLQIYLGLCVYVHVCVYVCMRKRVSVCVTRPCLSVLQGTTSVYRLADRLCLFGCSMCCAVLQFVLQCVLQCVLRCVLLYVL